MSVKVACKRCSEMFGCEFVDCYDGSLVCPKCEENKCTICHGIGGNGGGDVCDECGGSGYYEEPIDPEELKKVQAKLAKLRGER